MTNAIRTIEQLTGTSLTIAVPSDWAGKQVEVIIIPVETSKPLPPEFNPRFARFIMPQPPLSDEQKKELERNPFPLRGTGGEYIDPFEPAVPPEDWEVYRNDPA